jgi:DNA-binding XRE family transcriptional regulator
MSSKNPWNLKLKKQRIKLGLVQGYVAKKVGITQAYYSAIESDASLASSDVLLKICEVLEFEFKSIQKEIKDQVFINWLRK